MAPRPVTVRRRTRRSFDAFAAELAVKILVGERAGDETPAGHTFAGARAPYVDGLLAMLGDDSFAALSESSQ